MNHRRQCEALRDESQGRGNTRPDLLLAEDTRIGPGVA